LSAVYSLVQARVGGSALPSRMIKAAIEAGTVRSRAWLYKGRVAGDPNVDDQSFWHPGTPLISWKRSSIWRQHGGGNGKGYTAHQVQVRREDIDDLIAAWAATPEPNPALAEMAGDSPQERRARRFLLRLMERHPNGLRGKAKKDFARVCCERFKISLRSFERFGIGPLIELARLRSGLPGRAAPAANNSPSRIKKFVAAILTADHGASSKEIAGGCKCRPTPASSRTSPPIGSRASKKFPSSAQPN
jgi:hypothetical protein